MDSSPAILAELLAEVRELRAEVRELRAERRPAGGELLTTEEAAARLRLSPAALIKRAQRKQIQPVRLGRRLRFRRRDVDALVGKGRDGAGSLPVQSRPLSAVAASEVER